jgi:hypothetical protein
MNLILASRRGNTIYQINRGNGSKTILKTDGEISGPRYIAYEPIENLLCVQLDECVLRIYNTPLGLGTSIYQLTLPPNLIDEISVLLIAET